MSNKLLTLSLNFVDNDWLYNKVLQAINNGIYHKNLWAVNVPLNISLNNFLKRLMV